MAHVASREEGYAVIGSMLSSLGEATVHRIVSGCTSCSASVPRSHGSCGMKHQYLLAAMHALVSPSLQGPLLALPSPWQFSLSMRPGDVSHHACMLEAGSAHS